jgi:hypothetical protein
MIESISQDDICAVSDIAKHILEGKLVVNYVHRQKLKQYKTTMLFHFLLIIWARLGVHMYKDLRSMCL